MALSQELSSPCRAGMDQGRSSSCSCSAPNRSTGNSPSSGSSWTFPQLLQPQTPQAKVFFFFPICSLYQTRGGSGCHSQLHPTGASSCLTGHLPVGPFLEEKPQALINAELGKPHSTPGQAPHGSFYHHSPTFLAIQRRFHHHNPTEAARGVLPSLQNTLPSLPRGRILSGEGSSCAGLVMPHLTSSKMP